MKKFDFSSFAYNPDGPQNEPVLPPKVNISNKNLETDDESEEEIKSRFGRKIQFKNSVILEDSSDDSENQDEFIVGRKSKPKERIRRRIVKDDLDTTGEFRPIKKVNKSISIEVDDKKSSLAKPLKILNYELTKEKNSNKFKKQSLEDEINLLINDDNSTQSSEIIKPKRKLLNCSDDDDSIQFSPAKKTKKNFKKKVAFSDTDSNQGSNADSNHGSNADFNQSSNADSNHGSNADSNQDSVKNEDNSNFIDDIHVVLDEEVQSDEDYESNEDILNSDDEDEEKKPKKSEKAKSRIETFREAVVKLCNEGIQEELLNISSMSKKIHDELVSLRPYENWKDFIKKCDDSNYISQEVIEKISEYIKTKNVISHLMDECQKISNKIKISVANLKEHREPKCLNKKLKLKSYQLIGLNWMAICYKQQINGILADEMGLGKTIQVISLLAYLREDCNLKGPHLIVVPSSIMNNWEREFELWCPKIKIIKYYGTQQERADLRYNILTKAIKYDVIITTYNMLYSTDDKKLLTKMKFEYAIFDEAHMLKNMKSSRFKNLFSVKAKNRLMLTGTPIQNNLLELISLLTFTVPNLFYSKLNYMENFFKNKKFDDNQSVFVQEKTNQAKEILKPFILRRIKDNVLKELPNKKEQYLTLNMTENQETLYKNIIEKYSKQIKERKELKLKMKKKSAHDIDAIEEKKRKKLNIEYNENKLYDIKDPDSYGKIKLKKGDELEEPEVISLNNSSEESNSNDLWATDNIKTDDKLVKERQGSILMELRKCANHPLLIRNLYTDDLVIKIAQTLKKKEPYYQKDGNLSYMIEDMQVLNDFDIHMLCKKFPCIKNFKLDDEKILESGKFIYLGQTLDNLLKNNQKVLVFSQFVMMLDIIEEYLKIKSLKYLRLDGSTKVTDRMSIIDGFSNKEISIFLLTTKAGGIGINLVEANNVIIHDIDFNPFNDKQAEDRAHRMGQTQEVNIFKLVSENTVEVHMKEICLKKLSIGMTITSDKIEKIKQEESSDVKILLKKALQI